MDTIKHQPRSRDDSRVEVMSVIEIPPFKDECEEAEFWTTHTLGDAFWETAEPVAEADLPPARTRPVAVRFDASTLARLRALAKRRGKGYQTLLKEFVIERLYEEEKREGIIGDAPAPRPRRSPPAKTG